MANNKVCIGGIDLDKSISVRLLDKNGHHETKEDCLYNILDIFEIEYLPHPRPLPHSEDIRVSSRFKIGEIQDLSMLDILHKNNVQVYSGNIRNNFDGKLNCTNSGSLYISEDVDGRVPQNSTCFWICDEEIRRKDYNGKIRYNYNDGTRQWGYYISYVGFVDNPVQVIPKGTLIRLSLAHWWKPQNSENEERCYLQISGWYPSELQSNSPFVDKDLTFFENDLPPDDLPFNYLPPDLPF